MKHLRGTRTARTGRGTDDDGAVLVESVFVLPIVVLLLFGIIEFGLFFSTQASATSTAREGARYASANFAVAANSRDAADSIRDEVQERIGTLTGLGNPKELLIYKAGADGEPAGGLPNCTSNCFRYVWNGSSFEYQAGNWPSAQIDACSHEGDRGTDRIGIYVDVDHDLITGFFGSTASVKKRTALRLEPLPIDQC